MKIVITGASGFVGRRIVPRLARTGAELVLVGRNPGDLKEQFPDHIVTSYQSMAAVAQNAHLLVHLAVRNNDQIGTLEEFEATNFELLKTVVELAKQAGICRILNVSSILTFDRSNQSPYAVSKRKADEWLAAANGIEASTLYLPIVYGDGFTGKLESLNNWPSSLVALIFPVLAALKPTAHVDRIVEHILGGAEGGILSDGQSKNPVYRALRSLLDWGFALTITLLLWWVLLTVWIVVRTTSPGPGFFVQQRVGRAGRLIKLYKFRTMALGTKQAGTHQVSAAAVTPIGAFLRRTKLDELPQVLNIFKGELSLIGPRPCLPVQTELVEERRARGVLDIRPGISGLAQIEGIDMSVPVRLAKRDADYIALQSVLLDLKITVATVMGRGQGDRVAK